MVHQASKMDICDREEYLNWLADYEFNLFKIPQPDCVIFLDVPIEFSKSLWRIEKIKLQGKKKGYS